MNIKTAVPEILCDTCKDLWECKNEKSTLDGCPGYVHYPKPKYVEVKRK